MKLALIAYLRAATAPTVVASICVGIYRSVFDDAIAKELTAIFCGAFAVTIAGHYARQRLRQPRNEQWEDPPSLR